MSDIKLFALENGTAREVAGTASALEKSLQTLIERNLEALLGIRLLASEYSTGPRHGGRIDTLGIDENGSPVMVEYKRATNENVITRVSSTSIGCLTTGPSSSCWFWRNMESRPRTPSTGRPRAYFASPVGSGTTSMLSSR